METDLFDEFLGLDISQARWTTFHPFPRLPLELRLKIWRSTSPRPSVIFCGKMGRGVCYRLEDEIVNDTFNAVIHTCRESREEFLGLSPGAVNTEPKKDPNYLFCQFESSASEILFSPDCDTLDVGPERIFLPCGILPQNHLVQCNERIAESLALVKYLSTSLDRFLDLFPRHLAMELHSKPMQEIIPEYFPTLEIITFKIDSSANPSKNNSTAAGNPLAGRLLQEIQTINNARVRKSIFAAKDIFADALRKNPSWKVPLLRFCDEQDFLQDPLA